jgi:hypothetical protein
VPNLCMIGRTHAGFAPELQLADSSDDHTTVLEFIPEAPSPLTYWPRSPSLTTTETPQHFATIADPAECKGEPNLPSVADAVIDKWRQAQASRAGAARKASGRRRFVDPTSCEKDYNEAEMEFMQAMQLYKQANGRSFSTWSEVLEVLKGLGYEKTGPETVLS